MKTLFVFVFLLATLLNMVALQMLPDRVATHFGKDGRPDGWMAKDQNFYIMQGLYLFLFLMFYFMPALIVKTPVRYVSLPNRDYWLSAENREKTVEKIAGGMYVYGILLFLFFVAIGYLTTEANLNDPVRLDESKFGIALVLFLMLTIIWTVRFMLAFRLPEGTEY